ncbi:MAG: hypothetical protein ACK41F_13560 [Fimbriimonadaceae bacterium]
MPQGLQVLIALCLLGGLACGPDQRVPGRVRMADESLAELGSDRGVFQEEPPVRLPREWSAQALCLSAQGPLIGSGSTLWRLKPDGRFARVADLPEQVSAVAAGGDGQVWAVGPTTLYRVERGVAQAAFRPSDGSRAHLVSVAAGPDRIWVGDAGNRRVWILDGNGRLVGSFGSRRGDDPGLVVPSPHLDVAALSDGRFANVNPGLHRIELRTPDGRLLGSIGEGGSALQQFTGCCNPTDIAVLPGDRLATMEKGLPRIKLYDLEGGLLAVVAGTDAFHPSTPGGDLAASADGRIWFLDQNRGELRRFRPKGDER